MRFCVLCPVHRHFKICQDYGIEMIPVPLNADGPTWSRSSASGQNPSVKAMWCSPKSSNPTGTVYSDAVIERLAAMKTAAPDFRLYWDNAYAVHHLTDTRVEIANIFELCARHRHPDRPLLFASTSKITLAGAGLAISRRQR